MTISSIFKGKLEQNSKNVLLRASLLRGEISKAEIHGAISISSYSLLGKPEWEITFSGKMMKKMDFFQSI